MFEKVLDAAKAVFGFLNGILGLFKKPLEQRIEDNQKGLRDEMDNFKKSGRPK